MHQDLLIFAGFTLVLFIYGLFSKRAENSVVTGPMVFLAAGIVAGPIAHQFAEIAVDRILILAIAEIALIVILFTDAARIDFRSLIHDPGLPVRLLSIGLPLTVIAGTAAALIVLPDLTVPLALLVGAILAPTDAALSQATIANPQVPPAERRAINVESGLNDGLVLPLVLAALVVHDHGTQAIEAYAWLRILSLQMILGPLAGAAVGYIGGWLIEEASDHHWMTGAYQRLCALALALIAYVGAEAIGGNGFIAAFVAGLTLTVHTLGVRKRIEEFGEAEGTLLALLVFYILGLTLVAEALPAWSWREFVYAGLSLTVVRIVPVFVALLGASLSIRTMAFIGWFGPRGIASALYLFIAIEGPLGDSLAPIVPVVVLTISLSIVLHGLSAAPLGRIYGRNAARGHGPVSLIKPPMSVRSKSRRAQAHAAMSPRFDPAE